MKRCECGYHRYHVVHVYRGRVYDHSQATWDAYLRGTDPAEVTTVPSEYYQHGMTAEALLAAYHREV